MSMFKRPCIDCGRLSTNGTRCAICQSARDIQREQQRGTRPWYHAAWRKLSKLAIASSPVCARCGATEDLTTDHVDPRSLRAGVRVLCRTCNSKKGAKLA